MNDSIEIIIDKYKNFLQQDDVEGFYNEYAHYLYDKGYYNDEICSYIGSITQYFINECGLSPEELMSYFKDEIPYGCFFGTDIKTVTIPDGIKRIGEWAFAYSDLENIKFPKNTDFIIGEWSFSSCKLKSVEIPYTIKYIWEGAFSYCSNLKSVKISDVTDIGTDIFKDSPNVVVKCHKHTMLYNYCIDNGINYEII